MWQSFVLRLRWIILLIYMHLHPFAFTIAGELARSGFACLCPPAAPPAPPPGFPVGGAIVSAAFLCCICGGVYKAVMLQKKHNRQRLEMEAKLRKEVQYNLHSIR